MSSSATPTPRSPASILQALQPTHARPSTGISPAVEPATTSSGFLFQQVIDKVDAGNLPESNASALPASTSPQIAQPALETAPSKDDAPPSITEQRPGYPDVAKCAPGQVIKPRINVMSENDGLSSRSAPTLAASKVSGKTELWNAQLTPSDAPNPHAKAGLTQSTRQQSQQAQDRAVESDADASPAATGQMPGDRPEHVEKSRRSSLADISADSGPPAATVIPQTVAGDTTTVALPLVVAEPSSPLNKAPSTKDDVRTAPRSTSAGEHDTRPVSARVGISGQATQLSGDSAGSSILPAGSAPAHPHAGPHSASTSVLPPDRETPSTGPNVLTRETPSLPSVRAPLEQAGFHLSSISAPATAGSTDNQLLTPQLDPATQTKGVGSLSAKTGPDPVATPAGSGQTPTAQLLPAMIAFAGRTDGSSQMTVSLHPRDLGEVEVHLVRQTDGSTTVTVVAGVQTLQELSQNAHHLHAALDAANLPAENRTLNFVAALDPHSAQHGHTASKSDDTAASQNQNSSTSGNQGQTPHQRHNSRSGKMASDENTLQGSASVPTNRQHWQMSGLNITA